MNRVSRDIEKRVLEMHFNGVPRDAIARNLGISSATVSGIISTLPASLAPLRELSVTLRKNNMIPQDVSSGINILNELRALSVSPQQFSSSLHAVIKTSTEAQYKPETVVRVGAKLIQLENQAGKPYLEALKEFELTNAKTRKKKQQHEKLETEDLQLQAQIRENEKRKAQTYEAANQAPEEISKFKEQRAKLAQNGLNFNDYDAVTKLLENVKEAGGDTKQVITLVKNVGSLTRKEAHLQKNIEKMKHDLEELKNLNELAELELSRKHNQSVKLDCEIQSQKSTLADQYQQIQTSHAQLSGIRTELERIINLRNETIAQIGRWTGMSDPKIACLQMQTDLDITYQHLQKGLKAFVDQCLGELHICLQPTPSDTIITIENPADYENPNSSNP